MIQYRRKKDPKKKGTTYFNFSKFERLLDGLRASGIKVTADDYQISNLKSYQDFEYFFETFSNQEIKAQLLFYQCQLDGHEDS
ncbi:MAG: hypothetical protein HN580_04215 [Deltaproteobacteria bacterium]|jgi:hypothetical protein|nr:hypothetical protein [Deltaproteobacteria bacterium]MBT4267042.1 hypothetical protein [Deltaproteobacteria bacterium]MBT4639409.1 hypothetical protein [Deltaproteobacteria bacterium]MBT6615114.1 hypothetical protein [Deltaproteobacteria bacterium]MBT7153093.1 hypothetical protein [Deltaproteobacteria bacterium]